MIRVAGRELRSPVPRVTVYDDRVAIRLDDAARPDFWLEMVLDTAEVRAWLRLSAELPPLCACEILPMPAEMIPPLPPGIDPGDDTPPVPPPFG